MQHKKNEKYAFVIQIDYNRWCRVPNLVGKLNAVARLTVRHLPKKFQFSATSTVVLTNDKALRKLNRDFRGINKPTNVLSFPQFGPAELPKKGKSKFPVYLGDILIGYQYVVGEAKNTNKILINHVTHLLIHGLLHLLGYDHLSEKDAVRMERLEQKIMSALDLPNPYRAAQKVRLKKVSAQGKNRRAKVRPKQ